MRRNGWMAAGCAAVALVAGCSSSDSGSAGVATEVVYVDAQGNPVAPPSESPPTAAGTTVQTPAPQLTPMQYFQTPDGQTRCGSEAAIAGDYGGYDGRPDFACLRTQSAIARPNLAGCSGGASRMGGAAALGAGWVARGVCTGGWVFRRTADSFPTAPVGTKVGSGPAVCTITAADTVSCDLGGNGFTLSNASVTARGNDVTRG
ncbi:MAG: hypothetical protein QM809_07580 [Gordonia sp. (in: high G+C Gram-positive bacteria)]|uniref:hypothetical protein n=1 Tax=Gordonia sp. (in: high G+C Gram-positive bacteria) TaxID=84139 RepID=UPI0039E2319C